MAGKISKPTCHWHVGQKSNFIPCLIPLMQHWHGGIIFKILGCKNKVVPVCLNQVFKNNVQEFCKQNMSTWWLREGIEEGAACH